MFNLNDVTNGNKKEHNKKWLHILDHPYRILIIGGSGSRKIDALLNVIKEKGDIDKMFLYAKDLSETKYEFLIERREDAGIKHLNNSNAFIECRNTLDGVYENIDDCNPNKKKEKFLLFLMTWLHAL